MGRRGHGAGEVADAPTRAAEDGSAKSGRSPDVAADSRAVEQVLGNVRRLVRLMDAGPKSRNGWEYRLAGMGAAVWPDGLDRRHLAGMPLSRRTRNCLRDAGLLSGAARRAICCCRTSGSGRTGICSSGSGVFSRARGRPGVGRTCGHESGTGRAGAARGDRTGGVDGLAETRASDGDAEEDEHRVVDGDQLAFSDEPVDREPDDDQGEEEDLQVGEAGLVAVVRDELERVEDDLPIPSLPRRERRDQVQRHQQPDSDGRVEQADHGWGAGRGTPAEVDDRGESLVEWAAVVMWFSACRTRG